MSKKSKQPAQDPNIDAAMEASVREAIAMQLDAAKDAGVTVTPAMLASVVAVAVDEVVKKTGHGYDDLMDAIETEYLARFGKK